MFRRLPPVINLCRLKSCSHRLYAIKVQKVPPNQGNQGDFRPPWVYTTTRVLSYTLIPSIGIYAIFFYDFGDREHVFQPPRRWVAEKISSFFTPSSVEEKMLVDKLTKETHDDKT